MWPGRFLCCEATLGVLAYRVTVVMCTRMIIHMYPNRFSLMHFAFQKKTASATIPDGSDNEAAMLQATATDDNQENRWCQQEEQTLFGRFHCSDRWSGQWIKWKTKIDRGKDWWEINKLIAGRNRQILWSCPRAIKTSTRPVTCGCRSSADISRVES